MWPPSLRGLQIEWKGQLMDFNEWLDIGLKNKWVSDPYCDTHDGGPFTEEEWADLDEGNDPCRVCIRIWNV